LIAGGWLTLHSQEADSAEAKYHFELQMIGGMGVTRYEHPPSVIGESQSFRGWNVNLRFMWHPDHLLSMGLMTGYQVFSREDTVLTFAGETEPTDLTLELSSVPVHLAFEMRPLHIRVGAGLGVYVLMSQLIENGVVTYSTDYAYGGSAWVGYEFDITESLHIGPDLVLQLISDRSIANLSAMLVLRLDVLEY
jgi:hypothetical protein